MNKPYKTEKTVLANKLHITASSIKNTLMKNYKILTTNDLAIASSFLMQAKDVLEFRKKIIKSNRKKNV